MDSKKKAGSLASGLFAQLRNCGCCDAWINPGKTL
jgi:hypothetical protein